MFFLLVLSQRLDIRKQHLAFLTRDDGLEDLLGGMLLLDVLCQVLTTKKDASTTVALRERRDPHLVMFGRRLGTWLGAFLHVSFEQLLREENFITTLTQVRLKAALCIPCHRFFFRLAGLSFSAVSSHQAMDNVWEQQNIVTLAINAEFVPLILFKSV